MVYKNNDNRGKTGKGPNRNGRADRGSRYGKPEKSFGHGKKDGGSDRYSKEDKKERFGKRPGAAAAGEKRNGKNHHADVKRKFKSVDEFIGSPSNDIREYYDHRPEKRSRTHIDDVKRFYGRSDDMERDDILAGRNPVMEALRSGRGINKILMTKEAEGLALKIAAVARDMGVLVQYTDRKALDRAAGPGVHHQGVVAYVTDFVYCEVDDILENAAKKGEDPFVIVLDGIEDPHNLGAIIRSADASGAHGIIIPKHRAVAVTATAEKSSAGAAEYVPVARVTNINAALEKLRNAGVWTAAVDMDGDTLYDAPLDGPVALVIGSEGRGISRNVKENCDICVSIPMKGGVNSLNASNAAAVLMYEVVRRRR